MLKPVPRLIAPPKACPGPQRRHPCSGQGAPETLERLLRLALLLVGRAAHLRTTLPLSSRVLADPVYLTPSFPGSGSLPCYMVSRAPGLVPSSELAHASFQTTVYNFPSMTTCDDLRRLSISRPTTGPYYVIHLFLSASNVPITHGHIHRPIPDGTSCHSRFCYILLARTRSLYILSPLSRISHPCPLCLLSHVARIHPLALFPSDVLFPCARARPPEALSRLPEHVALVAPQLALYPPL